MNKLLVITIILFLIAPMMHAQTTRETFVHDNIERNYRIFVPEHYDVAESGHLIMVLHGGGMDNLLMRQVTDDRVASRVVQDNINAIVVYPNGFGNSWNDGRIREGQASIREEINDVDLLLSLADTLAEDYNIDPNALYIAGFSNGGSMAYRIACEASERVTAITSVSSLLASDIPCEPTSSVAVLSIIGDEDPLLPLAGGDINYWDMALGSVRSLDDTLAIWTTTNACEGFSPSVDFENNADDETAISRINGQDCTVPVSNITIHGGGHTWAGSSYIVPVEEYGRTSQDFNAGDALVDFFSTVGLGQN